MTSAFWVIVPTRCFRGMSVRLNRFRSASGCSSSTVPVFRWGDLGVPMHEGKRRSRHRRPERRRSPGRRRAQRERLPLYREPRGRQLLREGRHQRPRQRPAHQLEAVSHSDPAAERDDQHPHAAAGSAHAGDAGDSSRQRHSRHRQPSGRGPAPLRRISLDSPLGDPDRRPGRLGRSSARPGQHVDHLDRERAGSRI